MDSRRPRYSVLVGVSLTFGVFLSACGIPESESDGEDDLTSAHSTTMADVAAACAEGSPGVAIVTDELRDANVTVELPDCVIHLEQGADVQLNNVTITGGIINLHDRDTEPSTNTIRFERVTVDNHALLIELNDPDDTLDWRATEVTTVRGIGLKVAGTRDDTNEGGDIRLVDSSLLATDLDATIHILASEHSGVIRLFGTSVDTRGPLTIVSADCSANLQGELLDCSTASLLEDLG